MLNECIKNDFDRNICQCIVSRRGQLNNNPSLGLIPLQMSMVLLLFTQVEGISQYGGKQGSTEVKIHRRILFGGCLVRRCHHEKISLYNCNPFRFIWLCVNAFRGRG